MTENKPEAPEQDTKTPEVPEQRKERTEKLRELQGPVPRITVLGYMDSQIAIRLGWKPGMIAISQSRFRFLRDELGIDIMDNPDDYLF